VARIRWRKACLSAVSVALAGSGMLLGAGTSAVASTGPSTQQLAAEVEPAVQQEQTTYSGTLLVRQFRNDTATQDQLRQVLDNEQADGELADNSQSRSQQWIEDIYGDMDRYLKPEAAKTVREQVGTLCSGWFATPTGYLVTAAHCVNMSRQTLLADFDSEALGHFIDEDYRVTVRNWRRDGVLVDQSMASFIRKLMQKWFVTHSTLGTVSETEKVGLALRGASMATPKTKQLPARLVKMGTPFPGRDFAVLKVNGYRHLPSLALGSVRGLQVGDQLYVDGFPGSVSLNSQFTSQSRNTPTFTEGPLSALRTTTDKVQYLQTQAPAYEGNSGGPVLNASGQVIGILIAGAVSPTTGQIVAGEEFVLPATVIAAALAGIGVHPTEAPVTTIYAAALANYYKGYDSLALQGFKRVLGYFPSHPFASYYASLARQQVAEGHSKTPPKPASFPWLLIVLIVVIALVLLGASVLWMVVRGSRMPRQRTGNQGGPMPWEQPVPPAGAQAAPMPWPWPGPQPGPQAGQPTAPWPAPGPQPGPQAGQPTAPQPGGVPWAQPGAPAAPQAGPAPWAQPGPPQWQQPKYYTGPEIASPAWPYPGAPAGPYAAGPAGPQAGAGNGPQPGAPTWAPPGPQPGPQPGPSAGPGTDRVPGPGPDRVPAPPPGLEEDPEAANTVPPMPWDPPRAVPPS
jgi:serine protease Do